MTFPFVSEPPSSIPPMGKPYPVLVVEDDDAIRTMVTRLLAASGYEVFSVASAEQGLEKLRGLPLAVLVVDFNLPSMTGLDLIESLRGAHHGFEAVLMTAHADVDALSRALRLRVFQCVLKPFSTRDIQAAVAGAADRLLLRTALRERKVQLEERNRELEARVTELQEAQHQRMLSEGLASIGRLTAGVAHEINTPLATVVANLAMMAEELVKAPSQAGSSGDFSEMLQDAREGAERVRAIVRDLKALSRGDDETIGPLDLHRVIEAAIRMTINELRHRARVVREFGTVEEVQGNEARLGQVVINLLLNAAQAIPDGRADDNEIRVVTRTLGKRVVLEVRDTGTGIPTDVIRHIFEPFFTTKPIGVGTGLGLSISRGIVTSLGGEIQVESALGKGSVFRVLLPVTVPRTPLPRPSLVAPSTRRGRVLVIDDDALFLSTITRAIEGHHAVVGMTSAREALEHLGRGEQYDSILCDLMMPDMTGMDFFDELARTSPDAAANVIFVTGGAFSPRARDFLDEVPNMRLNKPFDPKQLRSILAERIRGR